MSKPAGRPPLPPTEKRSHTFRVRVKDESKERFEAAAAKHGLSISEALRTAFSNWTKLAESTDPEETRHA